MNIYFIRHGDPDYSTDSLTKLGHEQAKKLALAIKDLHIDEVYQSQMGRAKQTCAYSAEQWKLEPQTLDWAQELCWGDAKGDAYATESPWSINDRLIKNQHYYPAGEDWKKLEEYKNDRIVADVEKRCIALDVFLEKNGYKREGQLYKAEKPNNKDLAIFCHGGFTCACIAHLLNIPFHQFIAHVGLRVTSISKIHFTENAGEYCAAELVFLNDFKHLG